MKSLFTILIVCVSLSSKAQGIIELYEEVDDISTEVQVEDVPEAFEDVNSGFKSLTVRQQGEIGYFKWVSWNNSVDGIFVVEISYNGKEFEPIHYEKRVGVSKGIQIANYAKIELVEGDAYYRVWQCGKDGGYAYSDIIKVSYKGDLGVEQANIDG